ncbi:glycosyl transferase [Pseudomonas taiwanensis]|uniref:DUF1972 domain-containing protein n=1 Tax=Pseudomonas taiwanensis TaxID=470150 RepID=UPI0015BA74C0|nr:DUF1972 domain-containing protein [Pseudomonas taiwanensis]NWL79045.1 glycosyl transferase [Pseudomonas taiwanensis]
MSKKRLFILGIRGIPAQHGGFETFAEKLSLHLVEQGWDVSVYCQIDGSGSTYESVWNGVKQINIPIQTSGALGTIFFDWKATMHALSQDGIFLLLGYNTAIFNLLQRLKQQTVLINMDGIEWRRDKWSLPAKAWFWLNERIGCWVGHHLIADHPKIKQHLSTRVSSSKVTMIPYGAGSISTASISAIENLGLEKGNYSIIIARPEPENSFLEMVSAFSSRTRNHKLVVLGNFQPQKNVYHKKVMDAASDEVIFPGAIYNPDVVSALRYYCRVYLHGHTVGGTNPSLVEALGAGCAVLAHDNDFNRWVTDNGGKYFSSQSDCSSALDELLKDDELIARMKSSSRTRHKTSFTWEMILGDYERLITGWLK